MFQSIDTFAEKYKDNVGLALRVGISLVFFYFGINELMNPQFGINYIQPWAANMIPLPLETFILLFAVAHLMIASALLVGFKTRIACIFSGLMLLAIIINLSFTPAFSLNELAVRDLAILMANKALFINGAGKYSVDNRNQA